MENWKRNLTGLIMMGVLVLFGCGTKSGPTITSTTMPDAAAGAPYSLTLTASGGTSPYSWSVSSGALPVGLTLSSDGIVSGTPSTAGSSTFSVTVVDSDNLAATQALTLNVDLPSSIRPGMSIVLISGQSVLVPSGTTITSNGNLVTVNGDNNTISTISGAVVAVPTTATGTADNTVTAQ